MRFLSDEYSRMPALFRALLIFPVSLLPICAAADPATAALFRFSGTDAYGKPASLSSYSGKPVVVNFWARWCGPCRKEIPDLVTMDAKYRGKGIVILGLAVEEPRDQDAVRDFAKSYNVNYGVLLTGTSQGVDLMTSLGNDKSALPFTAIIDRNGKLLTKKLGSMSKGEMEAAIEAALK